MKKFICIILAVIFCASNVFAVNIATEYYSKDISSCWQSKEVSANIESGKDGFSKNCKSAVLIEKDTGKILYEYNANEKLPVASITKVMSLLLIMEAIESGKIKLNTVLCASQTAVKMGGSQIWLKENEKMTVNDLLKAAVIASANDAIVLLAEAVCGTEEEFVKKMNQKAAALKLTNTNFVNCSGLDENNHFSSAKDVAVMSCELLKHELIKKYSTVWMDTLRDGKTSLVNTNKMVRFYSGTTGLKTGTTSKAGFCVSASAAKNGMELCAVVLGAKNNDGRFGTAKALLNYGFANYKLCTVNISKKIPDFAKIKKGVDDSIAVCPAGVGKYLLATGEEENLKINAKLNDNICAPISKGQIMGKAKIMLNGKQIGIINIIAKSSTKKYTFLYAFLQMLKAVATI